MSNGNAYHQRGRILILGGTGEARALASRLVEQGRAVTSSLAGRTATPNLPPGAIRVGGFGGADGLADYIRSNAVSLVIDATHPFAARISSNAVAACAATDTDFIRLDRPQWQRPEGAEWIEVPNFEAAAQALPPDAKVLLTIGRQEVPAFYPRTDCQFVARVIEHPRAAPQSWRIIKGMGPFALEDERALLRREAITHLVSKNSGGTHTVAKLDAAAQLGIPVIMIQRPELPPAATASSVADLLEMIGLR
ncbi:cobalt-precorrin-6A reductase [Pelagibacterium luteolum]|uniref:Precorrin-6A/cobalt-precorrin-6A reductase n=1 Tax=Pelagibacterium luteolum TaxID=440168 RepID=A0A1G7VKC5_9HYPH|nr:cobalt-precorrin-6A reductase [Pelagibacterium luteolum]SDG60011.1 precorrin-6A/cobalt-precorrin-6A reductase [Pelagibacterium luteolum]